MSAQSHVFQRLMDTGPVAHFAVSVAHFVEVYSHLVDLVTHFVTKEARRGGSVCPIPYCVMYYGCTEQR